MADLSAAVPINVTGVSKDTVSKIAGSSSNVKKSGSTFKDALKTSQTAVDGVSVDMGNKSKTSFEKLEGQLKKLGLSQEDIKKVEDEVSKGNVNIDSLSYLLNILLAYNGNLNDMGDELIDKISDSLSDSISSDILKNLQSIISENMTSNKNMSGKNIIDKIVEKNVGGLSDILQKLGASEEFSEKLTAKLGDSILSKVSQGANLEQNIYNKIKSEINSALASQLNKSNTDSSPVEFKMQDIAQKGQSALIDGTEASAAAANKNVSQDSQPNLEDVTASVQDKSMSQSNSDKSGGKDAGDMTGSEEKILKNIVQDGREDKVSRAANFMTQFSNVKGNNTVGNLSNLPGLVVNKNSFDSDIIKALRYMDINNIKTMTVKINPKELGEITISLVMEEGKLNAVLTASNKDAYNLLNSNLQDLSNRLQTNDIKVQNFSLNLNNGDTTYFRDESGRGQQGQKNGREGNLFFDSGVSDVSGISDGKTFTDNDYGENNVNVLA